MSSVSDVSLRRAHIEWLAIPAERCPPNHYDLLSISLFEPDRNKILEAGKSRQRTITRKSAGSHDAALSNRIHADVRNAMNCLLHEATRAPYDQALMMQLQMESTRQPSLAMTPELTLPERTQPSMAERSPMSQSAVAPAYSSVSIQGHADPLAKFLTSNRLKGKRKNTPGLMVAGAAFLGIIALGGLVALFVLPGPMTRSAMGPTTATVTKTPTPALKPGNAISPPAVVPSRSEPTLEGTPESTEEPILPSETSKTNEAGESIGTIEATKITDDQASASPAPNVIASDGPVVSLPPSESTDLPSETPDLETTGNDAPSTDVAAAESSNPPESSATEPVAFSEPAVSETVFSEPAETKSTEETPAVEWSDQGFIKAVDLKPLPPASGTERFRTHETLPAAWAVPHTESMRPAPRFISMKPHSEAVFKIPKGTTGFEALAYSRLSESGKFTIQAAKTKGNAPPQSDTEWESLQTTPAIQYGELKVELTPAHRYLRLVADARPNGNDQMYWVRPIFIVKSKRIIVSEKMLAAPVTGFPGYFGFGVHHSCHFTQPLDTKGKENCTELFYGHAPAEISLPIPSGSKRFTALVGGLEDYKDVEVSIKVDTQDEAIYHTVSPNWDEIDVELPDDAKSLTLVAGPLGNSHSDQVAWLYPRFHNEAAAAKDKAKAAATWRKALAAGRAGTDPHVRISASCYAPETIASLATIVPGIRLSNGIGVISQLDGHNEAILLHPDTADAPATISFGRITSQAKGKLRLWTRNFPSHGDGPIAHRSIVKRNGEVVEDFSCPCQEGWQELVIPFDHQYITVEHQAVGWGGEHGCYDYEIVTGK